MAGSELGTVVLVGTNHVSGESSVHVRSAIRRHQPDVVAVELGETRAERMLAGRTPSLLTDTVRKAREGSAGEGLLNLGLGLLYESLEQPADGGDMVVGARTAAAFERPVALVDREISETLSALDSGVRAYIREQGQRSRESARDVLRLARNGAWLSIARAVGRNMLTNVKQHVLVSYYAAKIKDDENPQPEELRPLIRLLSEAAPEVLEGLLHERDQHIAGRLHALRDDGHDVVAVLGAAHLPGVKDYLSNPETLPADAVAMPDTLDSETVGDSLL